MGHCNFAGKLEVLRPEFGVACPTFEPKDAAKTPGATIEKACEFLESVSAMLREKNKAYGNSAFEPLRIFSKAEPAAGVRVRIDDKLSRIRNEAPGEDSIKDLIGYLAILHTIEDETKE